MAKDPAFLFYSQDFQTGTQFMSDTEVGKYIRVLMAQHIHGHLSADQLNVICGNDIPITVIRKLEKDQRGNYFNRRLEEELERRKHYTDSRRSNAQKKADQAVKQTKKPKAYAKHMHKHMENENENVIIIKKTEPEILLPFNTPAFRQVWDNWRTYRKSKKMGYKSALSEQQALKKLSTYPEDVAIAMIEQSIGNDWSGIFEIKTYGQTSKPKRETPEDLARSFAERIANRSKET